jgi:hypothetical protein
MRFSDAGCNENEQPFEDCDLLGHITVVIWRAAGCNVIVMSNWEGFGRQRMLSTLNSYPDIRLMRPTTTEQHLNNQYTRFSGRDSNNMNILPIGTAHTTIHQWICTFF